MSTFPRRRIAAMLALAPALALSLALALAVPSAPAAERAAPPCRLVVGGGLSGPWPEGTDDDWWNRLNFSYYDGVLTGLWASGRPVSARFHVAGSVTPERLQADALAQARAEGCDEWILVTASADDRASPPEVVFAWRATGLAPGVPSRSGELRIVVDVAHPRSVKPEALGERTAGEIAAR